ncbi:MAG: hypothetical protein JWM09_921 [Francisellaceae bacterium]|nr:hypothetical protein [Francisellaceae bacterium]
MKVIEDDPPFTAELDDFNDERDEVLHDHGSSLPFTRGFWLLSQLVAAINPDDLDCLDEEVPFTKFTMDNLMGRVLSNEEYQRYFQNNPYSYNWQKHYQSFACEQTSGKKIMLRMYPDGNYPKDRNGNNASNFINNNNLQNNYLPAYSQNNVNINSYANNNAYSQANLSEPPSYQQATHSNYGQNQANANSEKKSFFRKIFK